MEPKLHTGACVFKHYALGVLKNYVFSNTPLLNICQRLFTAQDKIQILLAPP